MIPLFRVDKEGEEQADGMSYDFAYLSLWFQYLFYNFLKKG